MISDSKRSLPFIEVVLVPGMFVTIGCCGRLTPGSLDKLDGGTSSRRELRLLYGPGTPRNDEGEDEYIH
jgi:hypothetical protein